MLNQSLSRNRKSFEVLMKALMLLSVGLTAALVLFLLIYVLGQGVPNITWELLSTKPSYVTERIGILPDILNTVYIVLATLLIVLPLGVGAAIYLTEYASNKKVVGIIEYAAETLSGIPSIIYGLVGMLLFSKSMGTCLMAGALTLVIMNLPTEGGEIIVPIEAVHTVIHSNQADTLLAKYLHDLTNPEIITSHAAHILHTDRVNLSRLHFRHHCHETGTIKAGARDAVIGEVNSIRQVMVSRILLQEPFLIRDRI